MAVDLKYLQDQLVSFERELEQCKAHAQKLLGAIELNKHLIADMEQDAKDAVSDPPDVIEAIAG